MAALHALAAEPGPAGTGRAQVTVPRAGSAKVELDLDDGGRGRVEVDVWAGEILCPVTLRSYALGAVHQALGLVWSEGIAVDDAGEPVDLTIRSFGILAAGTCPRSWCGSTRRIGGPSTDPTLCSSPRWRRPGPPTVSRHAGPPDVPPCARRSAT